MSNSPEEKKLIIDDDWKSQVQAEKEAAEQARQEAPAEEAAAAAGEPGEPGAIPPADFRTLVSMLATQAMMAMGAIPHPITGQPEVHLDQARHFIDLLMVLQEKTKGNLDAEEEGMIANLLNEFRMAFVAGGQDSPMAGAGDAPAEGGDAGAAS